MFAVISKQYIFINIHDSSYCQQLYILLCQDKYNVHGNANYHIDKKVSEQNYLWTVTLGLYSLSGKTSYRQISWSLEAARLGVIIITPLWNLTGTSAALLPMGPVKFQSNWKSLDPNLGASRLHEILR